MHARWPDTSPRRVTGMTLVAILLLASAFPLPGSSDSTAAKVPQSALALQISAANVPPGAMAQIRLSLAVPHQIASGSLVLDLDPSVFGSVAAIDVFSATGDQMGTANIRDRHVDAQFSSPTGGIGRLPEYAGNRRDCTRPGERKGGGARPLSPLRPPARRGRTRRGINTCRRRHRADEGRRDPVHR